MTISDGKRLVGVEGLLFHHRTRNTYSPRHRQLHLLMANFAFSSGDNARVLSGIEMLLQ